MRDSSPFAIHLKGLLWGLPIIHLKRFLLYLSRRDWIAAKFHIFSTAYALARKGILRLKDKKRALDAVLCLD